LKKSNQELPKNPSLKKGVGVALRSCVLIEKVKPKTSKEPLFEKRCRNLCVD
jgi:hypothetical protein